MEAQVSDIIGPLLVGFILGAVVGQRVTEHALERVMVEFIAAASRRLRLSSGWSHEASKAFVDEVIADVRKRTVAIDQEDRP